MRSSIPKERVWVPVERRTKLLILRWSLVITVLIAIWNGIIHFCFKGNVPWGITPGIVSIPRWWDIAVAPIWAIILVIAVTEMEKISYDDSSILAWYRAGSFIISFVSFFVGIFEGSLTELLLAFLILESSYSAVIGLIALAIWGFPRFINSQWGQKIGLWLSSQDLVPHDNHA